MKQIDRPHYMQRLYDLKNTPDIKIITGIRRAGKSWLLRAFIDKLRQEPDQNIIYIDFMDMAFEHLKDYHALYAHIEAAYQPGKTNYLFIDEVQLCDRFELAINSLHAKGTYDIYITGSNAFLLSADLATLFTGRYMEIHVFPFSFKEYHAYHEQPQDIDTLFDDYTLQGGFAGAYVYRTPQDRTAYIKEIYDTIINRDLIQKYKLSDTVMLDMLAEYLMDNISNLTSSNKISNTLTSNKHPANHVTTSKYIKYLCNAFLFYPVKRYDIRGKKYLERSEKYYLCDTGMRYAVLGTRNMDYGRVYENIVCLELLRRGFEVYVGKLYDKEIDFIAKRASELYYIQVSDDISREDTFQREVEPLLKIRDAHPKILLARTKHPATTYNGILIQDIARWLLDA